MLLLWQHQQAIEHQLTGQRQPKEGKREMLSTAVVGEISVCVCERESLFTMPTCLSMLNMRLLDPSSYSLDNTSFSTPNTTPSLQRMATAVLCAHTYTHSYVLQPSHWVVTAHVTRLLLTCCSPRPSWHTPPGKLVHLERRWKPTGRTAGSTNTHTSSS